MIYQGIFINGVVVIDGEAKPVEGRRVRVVEELETDASSTDVAHLRRTLLSLAGSVESGRTDGSVNHDHYIYGTPKRYE